VEEVLMSDQAGNIYKEIGSTGLLQWSGIIQEDLLKELWGRQGYKRFNEMRLNSPIVGALLMAIEQSIRGVDWTWTSELGEEDPRLEILQESQEHMIWSFNDHIIEALNMLPFGFALFEIVYQRAPDGKILWKKLSPRSQDTVFRWVFDESGEVDAVQLQAPPDYKPVEIPVEKLLCYKTRSELGNPEGRSILRTSWTSYYYLKNIQQIEAIGIERDLAGLPMITLPDGAVNDPSDPNSDSSRAAKLVRNIRQDEQAGVVLPSGWMFQLVSTGGSKAIDTDKVIIRYEQRILMSSLAQFLMLGSNKVGSMALSKDQTDLFVMSVNATADIIAASILHQAVPRLLKLNGYDADGITLSHSPAGDVDAATVSDYLSKLTNYITWTPEDESWLRSVLRMRDLSPDQIEEVKAEKAATALKIAQAQQPVMGDGSMGQRGAVPQPGPDKPGPGKPGQAQQESKGSDDGMDEQKMQAHAAGVDRMAVDPNDTQRAVMESRLQRKMRSFLTGEMDRILKVVKRGTK
jgi:hypothetical protein